MPDLSSIRDFAREQTLVETDDLDQDKLNNIVNQGVREVAARFSWPFLAASAAETLTAGQATVAIPDGAGRIESLVLTGTKYRLAEVPPAAAWAEYGDQFGSGRPTTFFLWGSSIYFIPVPSEETGLTINYLTEPTLLGNDEDLPQWDSSFHMVLADYAIWKLWEREEEYAKAQQAQEDFERGVDRMARFYVNRTSNAPLVIGSRRGRLYNPRQHYPFD